MSLPKVKFSTFFVWLVIVALFWLTMLGLSGKDKAVIKIEKINVR